MTTLNKATDVRLVTLGVTVTRAAALLPATAYGALFNINVGKVLITSMIGEVVVVLPATVTTLAIQGVPSNGGQTVVWSSASAVTSAEAGSVITPAVTAGGAVIVANSGAGNIVPDTGRVAQVGTFGVLTSATMATGTVKWVVTYVPLDPGANVTFV